MTAECVVVVVGGWGGGASRCCCDPSRCVHSGRPRVHASIHCGHARWPRHVHAPCPSRARTITVAISCTRDDRSDHMHTRTDQRDTTIDIILTQLTVAVSLKERKLQTVQSWGSFVLRLYIYHFLSLRVWPVTVQHHHSGWSHLLSASLCRHVAAV